MPAGGAGVNFVWTCTLDDLGEYVFSADADDAAATTSWPAASSASVLSAAGGGPNVVTWNLGSNTAAVPGEIITSGYTAGIYGFRGGDHDDLPEVRHRRRRLDGARERPRHGQAGRRAHDRRRRDDLRPRAATGRRRSGPTTSPPTPGRPRPTPDTNVSEGGALVYLNVGGTKYVYATMGGNKAFKRYDVAANTWTAMADAPHNVKKGGALTTDGTNIYALRGDKHKEFFRYNVAANTWTALATTAGQRQLGRRADPRRRLHLRA